MKNKKDSRRGFLRKAAVAAAGAVAAPSILKAGEGSGFTLASQINEPFRLKYAPSLGMFRASVGSDDPVDHIKFCYDRGFRAVFDNGFMGRPVEEQDRIAAELARLGMDLGPFVLYADFAITSFVVKDEEKRRMILDLMHKGVETAKRTNAKWVLVVPGRYDESLHRDYQTTNVIENLRYCAEILEPAGITMVLEPLNTLNDHPGLFLTGIPQAYLICRAVNSPSVKIINDLYHQQITEGNLIPNIEAAYSEIGAFHVGDNPGRKEPTSGEINYKNIFKFLFEKGYSGTICMEHGKTIQGKEGDEKVIAAYREVDSY